MSKRLDYMFNFFYKLSRFNSQHYFYFYFLILSFFGGGGGLDDHLRRKGILTFIKYKIFMSSPQIKRKMVMSESICIDYVFNIIREVFTLSRLFLLFSSSQRNSYGHSNCRFFQYSTFISFWTNGTCSSPNTQIPFVCITNCCCPQFKNRKATLQKLLTF